jgi:hypothetical protein
LRDTIIVTAYARNLGLQWIIEKTKKDLL